MRKNKIILNDKRGRLSYQLTIFTTTLMFIGIGTGVAFACGPSFDMAYLVRGSEGQLLAIPEGHFLYELELIAGKKGKKKLTAMEMTKIKVLRIKLLKLRMLI